MLTKFETKSNRVKGLSFHPTRPWILASLHIGVIQLWDYRMGTLLDRFDEHEGPVRGVQFHKAQPLFVSGGDDYKVKVWNYKQRKCLFTLVGHLDYIRTVQFHDEYPWILSASDDQTIRIWNWQSRQCIHVLTGHNHYVMCAAFHPKEDLVVSASLDQTVRVWDISGLRSKNVAPSDGPTLSSGPSADLFGHRDAAVKYVLEGHDRGVNWASFHPTLPLIVSGADDKHVILWRHNDQKAWAVDTFRGHFNNVSCVLFHPRQDLFISNSEDKAIRVWDLQKRTCIHTFRREHERFWILAAHPNMNLFAAGHDTGMIVFKLERERPGMCMYKNTLYYVKDRYIRSLDFGSGRDSPVAPIRRAATSSTVPPLSMSFNPAENAILLTWEADGGSYELYQLPKDGSEADCKRGLGIGAVFVARNRFAVLDATHKILIKNLRNEVTKRCNVPNADADAIFYAGTGCLLLRSDDRVTLFDVQRRKVIAELPTPRVRYVYWSPDLKHVALLCKHVIILCTRQLEQLAMVHETIRLKSGVWEENDVFIYTTLNHLKYALPNGDNGIIRTLDVPIYLTKVVSSKKTVYALDREIKNRVISIDPSEYLFKQALIKRNYDEVVARIRSSKLVGKSIVAYLQRKGFPEVALHFVEDPETRFSLAIECGNIEVALDAATVVDKADYWHRLGTEALRQGNHQVVEMAYQRTKNFEKLAFLYLITGNVDKLERMLKIAEMRGDVLGCYHNALYLGDASQRITLLENVGQLELAYLTAAAHGLTEKAGEILARLPEESQAEAPSVEAVAAGAVGGSGVNGGKLLYPTPPILRLHDTNWPLLTQSRGYFKDLAADEGGSGVAFGDDEDMNAGGWASDSDSDLFGSADSGAAGGAAKASAEGSGWGDSDSDLDLDGIEEASVPLAEGEYYVPPTPGVSVDRVWERNGTVAADCAAAGAFETAMQLLNRQIGAVNFEPLKPHFMKVYRGARSVVPGSAGMPAMINGIHRNLKVNLLKKGLPAVAVDLNALVDILQLGYGCVSGGHFPEAMEHFNAILSQVPLCVASSSTEVAEVEGLIGRCREYLLGLKIMSEQKEHKKKSARRVELTVYFASCDLERPHLRRALSKAMETAFKAGARKTAGALALRFLEHGPSAKAAEKARKIVAAADKDPTDELEIDYDHRNPFDICARTLTPIYKNTAPTVKCPFCAAVYSAEFSGELCDVCAISQIGADAVGLQLRAGN